MTELEKLQVLLPHWIEHHTEHAHELRTWAELNEQIGRLEIAQGLLRAAASLQQASDQLAELLHHIQGTAEPGSP